MEKLTGTRLASFVLLTIPLIRHLRDTDATMSYGDFAKRVGLIEQAGKWDVRYRGQITKILDSTHAIEDLADMTELTKADFGRIVSAQTGEPGAGQQRESKIVKRR